MSLFDIKMMKHALSLAMLGRITTPPNPWVGAVIVKNNEVVGEGFHQKAGEAHAETIALNKAGDKAIDSTVYVTLEPCSHFGRTPPCVQALINAKVARVVVGIKDPDPRVSGKGIEQLQQAGIKVDLGIEAEEIEKKMEPYLYHRRSGLPYCIAKAGISIDGRIAAKDGSSQWITSPEARENAQFLRAESQAILIGSTTAMRDNPSLTVRNISPMPYQQPLRVILDTKGKINPKSSLADLSLAPTLVISSEESTFNDLWKKKGADVFITSQGPGGINLHEVMKELGRRGILQVLVEGGGKILGSMLQAKLLHRFYLYMGSCILGNEGIPLFNHLPIASISQAIALNLIESKILGSTIRIEYQIG